MYNNPKNGFFLFFIIFLIISIISINIENKSQQNFNDFFFIYHDQIGDEMRDYPLNSIYQGSGFFDIEHFAIYANETDVNFQFKMVNIDNNSWTAPNGFSLPIFNIYINNKLGGSLESINNANFHFKQNQAWDWAVSVSGWSNELFSDENLNTPIFNNNLTVSLDKNSKLIDITLPMTGIGFPTPEWSFIVVVGVEEGGKFREIQKIAEEWKGGGGDDSNFDPNCYDVLVPEYQNESWLQATLLNSFNPYTQRKAEFLLIGPNIDITSKLTELPIRGVDISFLPELEDIGQKFFEEGVEKDLLHILKDQGVNLIRLRIWHTPTDGFCDLNHTVEMAKRLKALDFQFLLDFHYSDWWADPGKQIKPSAWENFTFGELIEAIYNYTKEVMLTLKYNNVFPDYVQIGNEIVCGMLWDDGRVCGANINNTHWDKLTDIINAGINGVKDSVTNETLKIMIHPAGPSTWFFDNLLRNNITFDIIGISYYVRWNQYDLNELKRHLIEHIIKYDREIWVVETRYPWTTTWLDQEWENNLITEYPASVEGQYNYLNDLIALIRQLPLSKGVGFCYWEPDKLGEFAFFDFDGNMLDSMNAFKSDVVSPPTTSDTIFTTSTVSTTTDITTSLSTIPLSSTSNSYSNTTTSITESIFSKEIITSSTQEQILGFLNLTVLIGLVIIYLVRFNHKNYK
jgi:arabinogalactan endo-1,4-beta-galactosidase